MRTRRLSFILAALLALGSLQATPAIRTSPSAQIRSSVCLVLAVQASARRLSEDAPPVRSASEPTMAPVANPRADAWLESASRFQSPPPHRR